MNKILELLKKLIEMILKKNNISMTDFEIFAKTLYFEAGSTQEIFDVIMVGWVIRNRVEAKKSFSDMAIKEFV